MPVGSGDWLGRVVITQKSMQTKPETKKYETCIKCGELILPNIGCGCTEDAAAEKLGWVEPPRANTGNVFRDAMMNNRGISTNS